MKEDGMEFFQSYPFTSMGLARFHLMLRFIDKLLQIQKQLMPYHNGSYNLLT